MAQNAQTHESTAVENLTPEIFEALPVDIGDETLIPEVAVADASPMVAAQTTDWATDTAADNPGLTAVVVLLGLFTVGGAIWGLIKGFIKLAAFLGIVALLAWWFLLSGR